MKRTRATSLGVAVAAALLLAACGGSDSVGSLEGDQGAGSALDRQAVCDRFEAIVNDSSLDDDEVRQRLEDVADDTLDEALAEQVRAKADAAADDGTDGLDAPRRCPGGS